MNSVEKLAKLLGRLQSDHNGEVIAAAQKINDWIKADGRNWNDALAVLSIGNENVRNRIIAMQFVVHRFSQDDQRIFYLIKKNYLDNRSDEADLRKLDWLEAVANRLPDDDIPF